MRAVKLVKLETEAISPHRERLGVLAIPAYRATSTRQQDSLPSGRFRFWRKYLLFASAAFGANAVSWWFVLDSAFSLLHRAFFNVWLVNGPCLLILGVAPAALRRAFTGPNAAQ